MNIYIFLKNGSPLFAHSRTSTGVRTHEDDLLRAGVFMISLCKISIRLSGIRISGLKPSKNKILNIYHNFHKEFMDENVYNNHIVNHLKKIFILI